MVNKAKILGKLYNNEWVIGIIYLTFGTWLALFGKIYFTLNMAILTALFTVDMTCNVSLSAGLMASDDGTFASIGLGFLLGITAGAIVGKYQSLNLKLFVLGMVTGVYSGAFFFAVICAYYEGEMNALWAYWLITGLNGVVGGWRGMHRGKAIMSIFTSVVGSYYFMRSLTMFYPGDYPSEVALVVSQSPKNPVEMSNLFWAYVAVFLVVNWATLMVQNRFLAPEGESNADEK